jgi:predicted enzyme related to lactoylglutathione lyase
MKGRNPIFIHYVRDMARARKFYESVFGVSPTYASSGWTTLDFGSFELALHILSPDDMDEGPLPSAGLCLEVDRIEEMQELIEQNGGQMIVLREPQPPQVPPRVASFRDCDGNGFDLRQYVEPRK